MMTWLSEIEIIKYWDRNYKLLRKKLSPEKETHRKFKSVSLSFSTINIYMILKKS